MQIDTHPLICYYKNTLKKDFPLILIVGREPNHDSPFDNTVRDYDFDQPDGKKSSMWNKSYGLFRFINQIDSTSEFKDICRKKEGSPILFTNLSPKPVLNSKSTKQKTKTRLNTPLSEYKNHFKKIFSKKILKRVSLIVISVDCKELNDKVPLFAKTCKKHKKKYVKIPYLANPTISYKKIIKTIPNNKRNIVIKTYKKWMQS